jgi:DNA-binding HxlR family transcriptional regulator
MNTPGKSDVVEAVVEILVLAALQDRGAANSTWLVRSLQQQTGGLSSIEEHSIRIALRKLEASGWIRKKGTASTARQSEKWELTTSANKCFPIEIRKWKSFMNDWPTIANLLRDVLDN